MFLQRGLFQQLCVKGWRFYFLPGPFAPDQKSTRRPLNRPACRNLPAPTSRASSSSVFFPGHPSSPAIHFCPLKKLIGQKQIAALQQVMQGPGGQLREGHKGSGQCQECQSSLFHGRSHSHRGETGRLQGLPPGPGYLSANATSTQLRLRGETKSRGTLPVGRAW